jgi:hypothetical protein
MTSQRPDRPPRATRMGRTSSAPRPQRASKGSSRPADASRTGSPRTRKPASKSGVPITDELAEKLADEAERGYELSHGHRVGRPSLAGRGVSPRVNFRTTPALHERARRRAAREGKTISQLAREALDRYVGS